MANRPDPYVKKDPGDIMLASDWNEMQVQGREELHAHRHTGDADGQPIPREGIAQNAIDGSRIDPTSNVTVGALTSDGNLTVKGELRVNGKLILDNAADLLAALTPRLGDNYIQNGTAAQTANFNITGNGTFGGTMVAGKVGIGAPAPRTALDTGTGAMSGAANDYQKAQFALSGGGTVTWDGPNGYLKWSKRFIAISMERTKTFSGGHINIALPSDPSLVTSWDGSTRVDKDKGILLKNWEALYAVHETGQDQTKITYQIVVYNHGTFHAPSNWLLVAVVNNDDRTVKLGTGATVAQNSSYASQHGSSLPRGAIIMWSGKDAPEGWALCDGNNGTPNLQGRFILAAGAGSGLTQRVVGQAGGEEKHQLTVREMPSHDHNVTDPGHLHNWTGSRQLAGTDDHNNTSEFSKGDRSTRDTVSKNTDTRKTGIKVNAEGGNAAHENMPPFYVLAYIMKL